MPYQNFTVKYGNFGKFKFNPIKKDIGTYFSDPGYDIEDTFKHLKGSLYGVLQLGQTNSKRVGCPCCRVKDF